MIIGAMGYLFGIPVIGILFVIMVSLLIVSQLTKKKESEPKSNIASHTPLIVEQKDDSEDNTSSKTEDKVTNISMDNYKTKEEHPMGDKTHD